MTRYAAILLAATFACGVDPVRLDAVAPFTQASRPDTPSGGMFEFDAGDVVESFDSPGGSFRIHFTRDGRHAVSLADDDADGTPDFVQEVATVYDAALAYFTGPLGFLRPLNDGLVGGGIGLFDVYLVDFARAGDGAFLVDSCRDQQCIGFMAQENDFAGYSYATPIIGVRTVGSHELFHAVQSAYDSDQGSVLSEGTAVWATESFAPELPDFENLTAGYLAAPEQALDSGRGYGQALFFHFLEERFGANTILALWESCLNGAHGVADPYWLDALDALLAREHGLTFADAFVEFATWNLFTSARADPARSYERGADFAPVGRTSVSAPVSDELRLFFAAAEYREVRVGDREQMTAALVAPEGSSDLEDLHLVVAVEGAGAYGEVRQVVDLASGTDLFTTTGQDRLMVAAVNSATDNVIRRPVLCVGSPEEVAACIAAVRPEPEPVVEKEGGCSATTRGTWAPFLVVAAAWGRRRFSRGAPAAAA